MTGFYKLFNLLVHVWPPYLFSEVGLCACHTLVTLMCECNSVLSEAFWHDNTVTSEDKLAKNPQFSDKALYSVPNKRLQSPEVTA